jgi:hypothetical protein
MAEEENVMRKELGLIGGISLAAGSTIGIVYEINLSFLPNILVDQNESIYVFVYSYASVRSC